MDSEKSYSSASPYWAKLVSRNPSLDNIILTKSSHLIGQDPSNDIQIKHSKIDTLQCKIYKDPEDCFWIQNLSPNCLVLEGGTIETGSKKQIRSGDKIDFQCKARGRIQDIPGFVFCPVINEKTQAKRVREDNRELQEKESLKKVSESNKISKIKMETELKCPICLDYMHSCVISLPCLHNFCASCISEWIKKSDVCPHCRGNFTELKKNSSLNNILESFMEENPELRRSEEEYEELNKKDCIRSSFKKIDYPDGGWYKGNILNEEREGNGMMIYRSGAIYEGQWLKNLRHGKGQHTYPDGSFYQGDWFSGKRQGKGVKMYPNGSSYEGDWNNDKKEGKGKMVDVSGGIYEGDWFYGRRHGKGKKTYPNGIIYEGDWKSDKKEGKGKMVDVTGNIYEGGWIANKKEGKGKITSKDGAITKGLWTDGVLRPSKPKKKEAKAKKD